MTDFETHPDRYVHWKLSVEGAVARLVLAVQEERPHVQASLDGTLPAHPPTYRLKLNSYDLGVDIELCRRGPAPALRAPRGEGGGRHQRQGQGLLRRRQHHDARPRRRTPSRSTSASSPTRRACYHRGRLRANSGQRYLRRAQRHRLGRRVRAGAGLRGHRAGRRRQLGGLAARGRRSSACCRAPAGSPGSSTSARSAATWPTSSPPSPRACTAKKAVEWGWSTRPCPRTSSSRSSRARRQGRGATPRRRATPRAIRLLPLDAARLDGRRRIGYRYVSARDRTRGTGVAEITVRGPEDARRPHDVAALHAQRRRVLDAPRHPRARRRAPRSAHQRDRDRAWSCSRPAGDRRAGAGLRRDAPGSTRDDWLANEIAPPVRSARCRRLDVTAAASSP